MTFVKTVSILTLFATVSACTGYIDPDPRSADKSRDRWIDSKNLSELQAGIWIDPNGCDHWIIDDGIEGYLSTRLQPNGKPVCTGHGAETYVYGPYQSGAPLLNSITEKQRDRGNSPIIPQR